MNRRELANKGFLAACGFVCAKLPESKAAEPRPVDMSSSTGYMDFGEIVVDFTTYQDNLMVACEHSVWEMNQGDDGYFTKRLVARF